MTHLIALVLVYTLSVKLMLAAEQKLPPHLQTYYDIEGSTSEDGSISEWQTRGQEFAAFFKTNWKSMLNLWEVTPPSPRQAALIRAAAEGLSGREYLDFLSSFLSHYEQGRVNKNVVGMAMTGMGQQMGFVASNFQHPEVQTLVRRYRSLVVADPDQLRWCDKVLKGDLRHQHQLFRGSSHAPEILQPIDKVTTLEKVHITNTNDTSNKSEPLEMELDRDVEVTSSPMSRSIAALLIVAALALVLLLLKRHSV